MATTKKSTKAKTKTTKAKTSKSASIKKNTTKAKAVNSTKKISTKDVKSKEKVVKTDVKSKSTGGKSNLLSGVSLKNIYAVSAVLFALIAGAAVWLMNNVSYQLSLGYVAKDELASVTETVFANASQGVYDVQIRWIVVAVAVLSIIMPVLYMTRLFGYHKKSLANKVLATRWIEMAVVSAIMLETVALLSGVSDIGTLKLVGGLMAVTCVLGWMAEKRTAEAGRPATAKYVLSMVTGFLPWVLIALYAISTPILGEVRYTWFVYALYAVMLIGAGLMGTVQRKSMKQEGAFKDYETSEKAYALGSLLTRTAFSVVLIVGLLAK